MERAMDDIYRQRFGMLSDVCTFSVVSLDVGHSGKSNTKITDISDKSSGPQTKPMENPWSSEFKQKQQQQRQQQQQQQMMQSPMDMNGMMRLMNQMNMGGQMPMLGNNGNSNGFNQLIRFFALCFLLCHSRWDWICADYPPPTILASIPHSFTLSNCNNFGVWASWTNRAIVLRWLPPEGM